MKQIPLRNTKGEVRDWALVDDEDFERVNAFRWHKTHYGYACKSRSLPGEKDELLWMHHFVYQGYNGPIALDHLDHKDRNRLNNQRANLREVTTLQNNLNRTKSSRNTSGYTGVSLDDRFEGRSRYRVFTSVNDQTRTVCYMDDIRDAAIARDIYLQDLYPDELITLNVPEVGLSDIGRVRQVMYSAKQRKGTVSRYVGVQFDKRRGTWSAMIKVNYKGRYLGRFPDELSAAQAYDAYCVENGLDRRLNFTSNTPTPFNV